MLGWIWIFLATLLVVLYFRSLQGFPDNPPQYDLPFFTVFTAFGVAQTLYVLLKWHQHGSTMVKTACVGLLSLAFLGLEFFAFAIAVLLYPVTAIIGVILVAQKLKQKHIHRKH